MHRHLRWIGSLAVVTVAVLLELVNGASIGTVRGGGVTVPFALMVIATAACYSTLLFRARAPILVYGILWTFSLSGLLFDNFNPFVGLFIALHTVASLCPRRVAIACLALTAVPCSVDAANAAAGRFHQEVPFVASFSAILALYMILAGAAWGVGRLSFLAQRRAELDKARAVEDAARAERVRLARELHDIVAHGVSGMLLQAAGARTLLRSPDDDALRHALATIEEQGVQAMREMHRLLGLLRTVEPEALDHVEAVTTLDDLQELVNRVREAGPTVTVSVAGSARRLDPSVDHTAYRIIQESLTNAMKHGGLLCRIEVRLAWNERRLQLEIENEADAAPAPSTKEVLSSGLGLLGLHERIQMSGGRLETRPTDTGFLVVAELPCGHQLSPSPSLAKT